MGGSERWTWPLLPPEGTRWWWRPAGPNCAAGARNGQSKDSPNPAEGRGHRCFRGQLRKHDALEWPGRRAGWTFRPPFASLWSFVPGISSSSGFVWSSSRFVNGRAFRKLFAASGNWSSAAASRRRCGGASSLRSRARPVAAPASARNVARSATASSAFDRAD